MRRGLMCSVSVLFLEAGLALAQAPAGPATAEGSSPYLPRITPVSWDQGAAEGGHIPAGLAEKTASDPGDVLRFSGEYLLWTTRGSVPAELRGVLSAGGLDPSSLLGSLALDSWRSGFRGFARYTPADEWLPGFEVGGFFLERASGSFDTTVTTHPGADPSAVPGTLLLQPVVGGVIIVPDSRGIVDSPIAGPGGSVDLDPSDMLTSHLRGTSRRELWGLEANVRSGPCWYGGIRLDGLVGFRNVNLREKLTVQGDFTFAEPPAGGDGDETPTNPEDNHTNVMHTFDTIDVRNNFYGGQIGASFETCLCERVILNGFAKFAVGGNWERVSAAGSTLQDATTIETNAGGPFVPRASRVFPGGLFTPPVPGGTVSRTTHLTVMPELNVNIGYQITSHLQTYVGYNYLYLSSVGRLGSQALTTGTTNQGHLDLHGVDFGVQLRW